MAVEQSDMARMRVVTISREYGSGGGEVATRLAARLGWQLVDHQVVARVAAELGVSDEEAREYDERAEGFLGRMFASLQSIEPNMLVNTPVSWAADPKVFHRALCRVVLASVETGPCVIVGRGAQMILRGRRDALHVRVMAPLPLRVAYVVRREGLSEAAARARIERKERDRAQFFLTHHRCRPDDAHLYDLVVNTGVLGLDDAVELASVALARKATRLDIPEHDLGPGAGLAGYPGHPADFGAARANENPPA